VDSVAGSGHILFHCFSLMPLHSDNLLVICGQCGRKWLHSVSLLQFDAITQWQFIGNLWTVCQEVVTFCFTASV